MPRQMSPRARCSCASGKRAKSCVCAAVPATPPADRRRRWADKMNARNRCLAHGSPKPCMACREQARERQRKHNGTKAWRPGGPGRPPMEQRT